MKTRIPSFGILILIAMMIIAFQSCGFYTPVLLPQEEVNPIEQLHLKNCPVVCKERTVFFEEHIYDPEAPYCPYCGQKQVVEIEMAMGWRSR